MRKYIATAVSLVLGFMVAFIAVGSSQANATGDHEECVPSEGGFTEWHKTGVTGWSTDSNPPGENTDVLKYRGPYTKRVGNNDATEGTAAVWANFSPNDSQATFIGPAIWDVDPRGTWNVHDQLPPGHEGPDGVYAMGNPDKGGNWFYRQAAVPGTPETFHTEYLWKVYEREVVPPVECPPVEICEADFEQGEGTADDMWEITWGQQVGSNDTATFNMQSFGGLIALDGGAVPGYMTPDWTWLYVTRAQDGRVVVYDFADGTRITATVSIPEGECPTVTWVTGSTPEDPTEITPEFSATLNCPPTGLVITVEGDEVELGAGDAGDYTYVVEKPNSHQVKFTLTAKDGFVFAGGETVLEQTVNLPILRCVAPEQDQGKEVDVAKASSYKCGDDYKTVTTTRTTRQWTQVEGGEKVYGPKLVAKTSKRVPVDVVPCATPGEPKKPAVPTAVAAGALPNTGSSNNMLPLGLIGAGLLVMGASLMRLRRHA